MDSCFHAVIKTFITEIWKLNSKWKWNQNSLQIQSPAWWFSSNEIELLNGYDLRIRNLSACTFVRFQVKPHLPVCSLKELVISMEKESKGKAKVLFQANSQCIQSKILLRLGYTKGIAPSILWMNSVRYCALQFKFWSFIHNEGPCFVFYIFPIKKEHNFGSTRIQNVDVSEFSCHAKKILRQILSISDYVSGVHFSTNLI